MPRGERPLDADGGVLTQFAGGLRRLREAAGGPAYRELARRAHYSAGTLSDAAGGRTLPSLSVTLAYVRACDGDTAAWEHRWHATAAALKTAETPPATPAEDGDAPYVGLAAFQPEDADRFFGRDTVVADLARRLENQRFLAVVGASGSGKSSLLRAGLVATLRPAAPVVLFTPGPRPLEECALALAGVTGQSPTTLREELRGEPEALHLRIRHARHDTPTGDLVMVVDQFEEIFTLCADAGDRARFITALLTAATAPTSRTRVVIGIRADFYPHCTRHPELVTALQDAQVLLGPLNPEQLRAAIAQPAIAAGLRVEATLLATLTAEAAGQAGVLPLLSHALRETWRHRQGTTLTLAGYRAVGGIGHAIARTAEAIYTDLSAPQQRLTRDLVLRLTALGEGTEDTTRRLRRHELDHDDPDLAVVVERLVQARLITVDGEVITLAHEALIRCWPRLRAWLEADRDGLRVHRRLTEATDTWDTLHRDAGALYRGALLAITEDGDDTTDTVLSPREREFLDASLAAAQQEHAHARRGTRRLRQLVTLLSVLVVAAAVVTGYAVHVQQTATQQRDIAEAQDVVGQADALLNINPGLALQLTLAAYRLAPTEMTRTELLNTLNVPYVQRVTGFGEAATGVAISPDQHTLAAVESGTVHLVSLAAGRPPTPVGTLADPAGASLSAPVAFSPDGHVLASAVHGNLRLWDITNPRRARVLADLPGPPDAVAFSAQGHLLAATGPDTAAGGSGSTTRLWNITDPSQPVLLATLAQPNQSTGALALSPDGRTLAEQLTSSAPGTTSGGAVSGVQLWTLTSPSQPRAAGFITPTGTITALSFAPAGALLALGTDEGTTQLWDTTDLTHPSSITALSGPTARIASLAFSPDDRALASATPDGSVWIWNVATPSQPETMGIVTGPPEPTRPADPANAAALSSTADGVAATEFGLAGHTVATLSPDGTVQLIDLPQFDLARASIGATAAAFSPNAQDLATTTLGTSTGRAQVWELGESRQPRLLATITAPAAVPAAGAGPVGGVGNGVAWSATAPLLATDGLGSSRLYNLSNPARPAALSVLAPTFGMTAFSPTAPVMATDGADGSAQLWDVHAPRHPRTLARLTDGARSATLVRAIAFSPHGDLLGVLFGDGILRLFDVTHPANPVPLASIPVDATASLAFAPGTPTLAAGLPDGTVTLWTIADPRHPAVLSTLSGSPNTTATVLFSPTDGTLALPGDQQTTQIWDVHDPSSPTLTEVVSGTPLAFSPDGHTLAVIAEDGAVQLRETDVSRVATRVCALTGATLNVQQWQQYFPGSPYTPPC